MAEEITIPEDKVSEDKKEETVVDGVDGADDGGVADKKDSEDKNTTDEEEVDIDKIEVETRGSSEEKVDYGDNIDPDDIKTIGAIVEKQTAGVKKALQETQDRMEVESFLQEKPEFAKYKPVIMKYLQHPVYSKIPVKNIASMVAANDLMKLGAKKEREAQNKADSTKTAGNNARRESGSATDWLKAPKDAFETQKRMVMGQR